MVKYELYFSRFTSILADRGYERYVDSGDDGYYVRSEIRVYEANRDVCLFDLGGHSGAVLKYLIDRDFEWRDIRGDEIFSKLIMIDLVSGEACDRDPEVCRYDQAIDSERHLLVKYAFNADMVEQLCEMYHAGELELTERV